ncbi:MAG: PqqD family protein [Clostridia bacterium]|nr:PqqD family protein [Clostridia bacterium]
MKIKSGFVVREVAGQSIVVALGEATKTFNGMIRLNETGRIIWDMLSAGSEKADIVKRITEEYDIDEQTVQADVDAFINTLQGANILE